jgi:hypothetical protein
MKNEIILNKAKFWVDPQGILFCEFNNKDTYHKLEVDTVERYEKAIATLTDGKPMPFLIDIRNTRGSFSKAAAELFANSEVFKKVRIYEAFVVSSMSTSLLINSYKRIYEPITPYIILTDIKSAVEYCLTAKNRVYADS